MSVTRERASSHGQLFCVFPHGFSRKRDIASGGSRPPPLFWVKKKKWLKGKWPTGQVNQDRLPPLAQGLDPPLIAQSKLNWYRLNVVPRARLRIFLGADRTWEWGCFVHETVKWFLHKVFTPRRYLIQWKRNCCSIPRWKELIEHFLKTLEIGR